MYFKLFKLHSRAKRSVAQPQTIYSEFPWISKNPPPAPRYSVPGALFFFD